MITKKIAIDDVNEAVADLKAGTVIRSVITFGDADPAGGCPWRAPAPDGAISTTLTGPVRRMRAFGRRRVSFSPAAARLRPWGRLIRRRVAAPGGAVTGSSVRGARGADRVKLGERHESQRNASVGVAARAAVVASLAIAVGLVGAVATAAERRSARPSTRALPGPHGRDRGHRRRRHRQPVVPRRPVRPASSTARSRPAGYCVDIEHEHRQGHRARRDRVERRQHPQPRQGRGHPG